MMAFALVATLLVAFTTPCTHAISVSGSWAIDYSSANRTYGFARATSGRALLQQQARVKFRPCGGAPDELLPFDIENSPWKGASTADLEGPS
eukprot:CAMPEP_0198223218 /NCGR_PEP_ID=MMETSP1445-20131203/91617_1 /TAXON_ID=36898 /ORGANISM="Pyramimonas sp., Strain CCMP2087" /LENGTH=91 /DNA_ID=CAMNT_0043901997 /DNA_START=1 /DNA_END=273 /DNA_ORIENTATION=+